MLPDFLWFYAFFGAIHQRAHSAPPAPALEEFHSTGGNRNHFCVSSCRLSSEKNRINTFCKSYVPAPPPPSTAKLSPERRVCNPACVRAPPQVASALERQKRGQFDISLAPLSLSSLLSQHRKGGLRLPSCYRDACKKVPV